MDNEDNKEIHEIHESNESFSFLEWFKQNNPLYLLSVVFMLLGLYLVSFDAQTSKIGVNGLIAFFAIQNIYEIVMVVMALYLLKNKIQPRHGKFLLAFVLLFLGDVTFYQVRISGLSVIHGNLTTFVYIILAIIKFAAVIKVLQLTIYRWRIFFVASSFALIWIGPKIAYNIIDSVGTISSHYFDATTILYALWFIVGLIHLPTIVINWTNNRLDVPENHELVGNETSFWRCLMIFPFIMLPIQLMLNVMADSSLTINKAIPPISLVFPWILMAGFFVQAMWKKTLSEFVNQNQYDSFILITLLIIAMAATTKTCSSFSMINASMVNLALLITAITRQNLVNAFALGSFALFVTGQKLFSGLKEAVEYSSELSKSAWAAILMVASFAMLALGFVVSLMKKETKPDVPDTGSGENIDQSSSVEEPSFNTVEETSEITTDESSVEEPSLNADEDLPEDDDDHRSIV
jgi:hypothetical protein